MRALDNLGVNFTDCAKRQTGKPARQRLSLLTDGCKRSSHLSLTNPLNLVSSALGRAQELLQKRDF
jgi:hypothetical protein